MNEKKLKVLYDDKCDLCSSFVGTLNKSSHKQNFSCNSLPKAEKLKEFQVIDSDGNRKKNFDAVLQIASFYPQWHVPVLFARLPLIKQVLAFGYLIFAHNRLKLSNFLNRFYSLKKILIVGMMAGLLLSPNAWFTERNFPASPLIPFMPQVPSPFDIIIYFSLLILLLAALLKDTKKYILAFIAISVPLALLDQSRWQPWFYQYIMMISVFIVYPWRTQTDKDKIVRLCSFIVASIYIFSGLQKFNLTFVTNVFPWIMEPLARFFPPDVQLGIFSTGIFIPFIETAIGLSLLTKKFRSYGILAAIGMHISILLSLGPWGHNWNSVVWPWNIIMCGFVVTLFLGENRQTFKDFFVIKTKYNAVILLLFGIMPILCFFNLWDSYLSASLYSGNTKNAQIHVPNENNESVIDLNTWSMRELNVPVYPEKRVFLQIGKKFCEQEGNTQGIYLQIKDKPHWLTKKQETTKYSCTQL